MFSKFSFSFFAAACLSAVSLAQTSVTTEPVGLTTTSCLGNSDTYLGIPFTRPPEFTGTVQSVSGSTLTINGAPGWTDNRFVYVAGSQSKHYYVLIGNGGATNPKEGHTYAVTSNGSNTLTVEISFDNLAGVVANTQVTLIPYWTPATIFPSGDAGVSFTATTNPSSYKTEVLIPNASSAGINLPPAAAYFFINNGANIGWRLEGDNSTNYGDDPLLPDSYLIVRNSNGAPTLPLTSSGSVLMSKLAVPILASASQQQDNPVAMIRPVDTTLDSNGLAPIHTSFLPGDQLLLFDNTQAQIGKQPNKFYTFNDGWRLSSDNLDHSKDIVPAGSAMLVRRAAKSAGTVYWVNAPTYVPATFLSPLAASSRKIQGAGTFDLNMPASNALGIECRAAGSGNTHQVVFTFANPVTLSSATATPGANATGSVSGSPIVSGNHVTVNLANVSNMQRLLINLSGVSDGTITNDFSVTMGLLLGDATANGRVDGNDVSAVQGQVRSPLNINNFRADVTANGRIDGNDASTTQGQVRTFLPPGG
jgi:uncharacterized protein (TIGR02597 family)